MVETETPCMVGEKDIASSFNTTLWIIFISHLMGIMAGILQILDISQIKSLLCCTGGFLGLAGWIMMHFVRFSYSGQVCSGTVDNTNLEDQNQFGLINERGSYLKGYLITSWCFCGASCLCGCCCLAYSLINQR